MAPWGGSPPWKLATPPSPVRCMELPPCPRRLPEPGTHASTPVMVSPAPQKFDAYAEQYRTLMDTSVKGSGESAEYFSEYKLNCLRRLGAPVGDPFLDFGAGTGSVTGQIVREYRDVTAYEPSEVSL